ncbi:mitogen-activated protein kinase 9-like [Rutidosis leptorrhynchoides]|uniref:mitogen-activated protein kinase 9-like n=1 Tax=Rutidosis leptorrhynchoides TaxID=125765 RepID=UPI003A98D91C
MLAVNSRSAILGLLGCHLTMPCQPYSGRIMLQLDGIVLLNSADPFFRNCIAFKCCYDRPSAEEILEYHPQMLQEYLRGGEQTSFLYPSGFDRFKRQFAHLEEGLGKSGNSKGGNSTIPLLRHHASLPRERVPAPKEDGTSQDDSEKQPQDEGAENSNEANKGNNSSHSLLKSASISASKCIGNKGTRPTEDFPDDNDHPQGEE